MGAVATWVRNLPRGCGSRVKGEAVFWRKASAGFEAAAISGRSLQRASEDRLWAFRFKERSSEFLAEFVGESGLRSTTPRAPSHRRRSPRPPLPRPQ